MINNPYQRYAEMNLTSTTPENLIVALYKHACDCVNAAEGFNRAGDPVGRGKAVNNALDILVELTCALDESYEIALDLRDLYGYMQHRLLQAHLEQSSEKLQEVARLLGTMLGAWREVAGQREASPYNDGPGDMPSGVVLGASPAPVAAAYNRF